MWLWFVGVTVIGSVCVCRVVEVVNGEKGEKEEKR